MLESWVAEGPGLPAGMLITPGWDVLGLELSNDTEQEMLMPCCNAQLGLGLS